VRVKSTEVAQSHITFFLFCSFVLVVRYLYVYSPPYMFWKLFKFAFLSFTNYRWGM